MARTSKYRLVSAPTAEKLSELLCGKLAEGWLLYRGPFAENGQLFQAMILKGKLDKRLRKTSGDGFKDDNS